MEIITPAPPKYDPSNGDGSWFGHSHGIFLGLVLSLAGVVWLLYNLDVVGPRFFDTIFSWQMLLIVLGGYLLSMKRWSGGAILSGIGLTFLVIDLLNLHISFNDVILPVMLIAAGVAVLLNVKKR